MLYVFTFIGSMKYDRIASDGLVKKSGVLEVRGGAGVLLFLAALTIASDCSTGVYTPIALTDNVILSCNSSS